VHPYLRCDAQLCLLLADPPTSQIADAEKSNRQAIHCSLSSLGFGLGRFSTQEFTLILSKRFALTKDRAQAQEYVRWPLRDHILVVRRYHRCKSLAQERLAEISGDERIGRDLYSGAASDTHGQNMPSFTNGWAALLWQVRWKCRVFDRLGR
jgi:hypothetical protein